MSVKEIETAITQLSPAERSELIVRLVEQHHEDWDRQIEDDLAFGRLESLLTEVDEEIKSGLAKPMTEKDFA